MPETIGTEPALQELLLKLHKGAVASFNAKSTALVLGLFPGWTIEKADFVKASDQTGWNEDGFRAVTRISLEHYSSWEKRMTSYTASLLATNDRSSEHPMRLYDRRHDKAEAVGLHANVAKFVVDVLPEPKKAKADAYYVMNLTAPVQDGDEWTFSFDLFRKCKGYRITSPDGQAFDVCGPVKVLGYDGVKGFDLFFKWAFANTNLEALINAKLGLEKHVPASERPRIPVGGQTIGTCAICSHHQVVRNGKMVLHGYHRPGYGYVIGNCFGVDYDPYETSAEACVAYIPVLEAHKTHQQARLADLTGGRVSHFKDTKRNYKTGKDEVVITAKGNPKFDSMLKAAIFDAERQISYIDADLKEMQRRIDEWQPGTLRRNEAVE